MNYQESVNPARSLYYGLFSKLFVFSSSEDRYDGVIEALSVLIANPMDENSCEALKEIKEFIEIGGVEALASEYDDIFHNPQTSVIRDTASYYDEGLESGKKRVVVKNFLGKTKIRRNEATYKDNEDSIGFLVTFMHELCELIITGEKQYESVQHCLFTEVINEFFDEFIANLYEHEKSNAYKSVAVVLNAFLEFERLYFKVSKPKPKEKIIRVQEECEFISDEEAKRRAQNRAKKNAAALHESCNLDVFSGTEEEGDL
ncbi:MAG: molecular chaperone TorD family protein [Campylobacteraceae bacterium]|nr:molecular chaperone TorD family protein [Campylobacteraceae bacterium]